MHKIIKILSICTVVIILGAFFLIPVSAVSKEEITFEDYLVLIYDISNSYYSSAISHPYYQQFTSPFNQYNSSYFYVFYSDSNFKVVDNVLYSSSPVGCEAFAFSYNTYSKSLEFHGDRNASLDFSKSQRIISPGGNSYYYYYNSRYSGTTNDISQLIYGGGSSPLLYYEDLDSSKPLSDRELAENVDFLIPGAIQPDGNYIPFGFSSEQQEQFNQDYQGFNDSFKDGEAFDPSFSKEPTENLLTQIASFFQSNADDAEPIKISGTIFGSDLNLTLLDPAWFNISNYAFLRLLFQLVISWHLLQFLVSLLFDILDIRHKGIFSTEGTVYDEDDQVTIMYSYDAEDLY